jgi:hypothetical protein
MDRHQRAITRLEEEAGFVHSPATSNFEVARPSIIPLKSVSTESRANLLERSGIDGLLSLRDHDSKR